MYSYLRLWAKQVLKRLCLKRQFGQYWSELWLKHVDPNAIFRHWFVLPFNGQAFRLYSFAIICHLLKPTVGIETGTYYGTSTYLFRGIPTIRKTYSIEYDKRFFEISFFRLRQQILDGNLEIINGDSKSEISNILAELNPETERVIAYLDAHWNGDIPTIFEVQSLLNWKGNWVALVDDFQIPGPSGVGYGYDSYNGQDVNSEIFDGMGEFSILVPSQLASNETGARRGTGYFVGGNERHNFTNLLQLELPLKIIRS